MARHWSSCRRAIRAARRVWEDAPLELARLSQDSPVLRGAARVRGGFSPKGSCLGVGKGMFSRKELSASFWARVAGAPSTSRVAGPEVFAGKVAGAGTWSSCTGPGKEASEEPTISTLSLERLMLGRA